MRDPSLVRFRRVVQAATEELERRRQELLPSFRILLDRVSSAEAGVSPLMKNN